VTPKVALALGGVFCLVAVAAGAFGSHGLRGRIDEGLLDAFETGARYEMFHGLALLAAAWAIDRWPTAGFALPAWLWAGGTLVFSGSLYVLALSGVRSFGAATPFGGTALLAGWVAFLVAVFRIRG
jgi:uncharacterized membrane protein YgdD (TMEM256/DUF423 family)